MIESFIVGLLCLVALFFWGAFIFVIMLGSVLLYLKAREAGAVRTLKAVTIIIGTPIAITFVGYCVKLIIGPF